jgi:hypothetical protein
MVTVFCNCEGMFLLDVMQRGRTVDSDAYISMMKKMRKVFAMCLAYQELA